MFNENENGLSKKGCAWIAIGVLVVFLIIAFFMSITKVNAGYVGVITRWGAVNRVIYPGVSWKIPIAEGVIKMDVRTIKNQVDAAAASRDLQTVTAVIAVNYHLDGKYATYVIEHIGKSYDEVVVDPAVQNIFKQTTAQFTAEELITKRLAVASQAEEALAKQMMEYHIIVENFNIVNFDFSQVYNEAIENKQVMQQQVETAKQQLAKTRIEAEIAVTKAQGEADAQAALKNTGALTPEFLEYMALQKWNGILPVVTSGTPFIDVTEYSK